MGAGVLVLHPWWGCSPFVQRAVERLTTAGLVAIAPDFYEGRTATTVDEARALMHEFDETHKLEVCVSALEQLQTRVTGKIGVLGFSMGAAYAVRLASLEPERIAAVVSFYGAEIPDFSRAKAAFQFHFAERDAWVPLEVRDRIRRVARSVPKEVVFCSYPNVRHDFMDDDRLEYDESAARQAWLEVTGFLRQELTD